MAIGVCVKPIIGVYCFCNTGSVLVHEFDEAGARVMASINGENPQWCDMTEVYSEETEELEPGFFLGSFFVPFCDVMRVGGQI